MSQTFELEINKIRESLLMMASLTDRNVGMAIRSLKDRDNRLAETVEAEDSQVDKLEVIIDDMVITYMATHGPIATDCRFMLVATKICSNLERIADQAVTIARRAQEINLEPELKPLIDLPRMAMIAQGMLKEGIDAFVAKEADLAREIIERDKQVDAINRQLIRELTSYMIEDPKTITRALNLMMVSKAIERMADHAKNIAEEVYYLYNAKDIRHEKHGIVVS